MLFKSKIIRILSLFFLFLLITANLSFAQTSQTPSEQAEAALTKVDLQTKDIDGQKVRTMNIEAKGLTGSIKDQTIIFQQSLADGVNQDLYKTGVKVFIAVNKFPDGTPSYGITDFVRTENQFILLIIFLVVLIAVAGLKGIRSIIGLLISLCIIIFFVIPNILNGVDGVLVSLAGAALILIPTVYFVHGFKRKSTVAVLGALISLGIAAILSMIFTQTGKITGIGNDDALYLFLGGNVKFQAQSLFLAGIIIGTLGVLIDMTIGQASAIQEIDEANPDLTNKELYKSGMNIGKDHIGSLVNTLFLAYAGATLPLLISFTQNKEPLLFTLSIETTAMEIIRAIIGSISLILAVPITTLLGVYFAKRK